jgi:hypothetical protein
MSDIQTILDTHSIEVQGLLRKHNIPGNMSIDAVKRGYDEKGEQFMMELLQIITPTSSFLGLGSKSAPTFSYDPYADPLSDEYATPDTTTATGKGWLFWDNLLNYANKTGETIGAVKKDISGTGDTQRGSAITLQQDASTNMLYYVAAGFVALIIIILIFRK